MSRALIGILVLAGLALAWWAGLPALAATFAREAQREFQDALGGTLRGIRAGRPGAILPFLGLCFGYGFLHAVGPGHGKAVLGSYGLAGRAAMRRMLALALVSSLAQATAAVVLVYAFVLIFEGARDRIEAFAGDVLTPLSWTLVGMLGLWLIWRGLRGLRRADATGDGVVGHDHSAHSDAVPGHAAHDHNAHDHRHDHAHHHHTHDETCGCGHAHGPTLEQAEQVHSFREAAALIAAIALRPCSGALLVLILTWRMGVGGAGIAGAYAMGLGTAAVTATAAALAVLARDGVIATAGGLGLPVRLMHGLELAVGAAIVLIAVTSFGLSG